MKQDLLYDPSVFRVGCDYQIIFRTKTKGLGWVEIDGARYTDEECGLLKYGTVHKISVPGAALDEKKKYTVVFIEYKEKPPYFPKGVETVPRGIQLYSMRGRGFHTVPVRRHARCGYNSSRSLQKIRRIKGRTRRGCDSIKRRHKRLLRHGGML